MNLKSLLKTLKINESNISSILGAIVIVVVGILVVNYFRTNKGLLPGSSTESRTESEVKIHTVAKGENLWKIAEQYYGSGYNWVDIASENKLANAAIIEEGQKLTIPDVAAKQATVSETSTQALATEAITGATYEVKKGDNLWNIAVRAYGDGYQWLKISKENRLANPDIIHPGNILILPR